MWIWAKHSGQASTGSSQAGGRLDRDLPDDQSGLTGRQVAYVAANKHRETGLQQTSLNNVKHSLQTPV